MRQSALKERKRTWCPSCRAEPISIAISTTTPTRQSLTSCSPKTRSSPGVARISHSLPKTVAPASWPAVLRASRPSEPCRLKRHLLTHRTRQLAQRLSKQLINWVEAVIDKAYDAPLWSLQFGINRYTERL